MAAVLKELSGGQTPNRVICCGHSLGGALATLGWCPHPPCPSVVRLPIVARPTSQCHADYVMWVALLYLIKQSHVTSQIRSCSYTLGICAWLAA